jgi:hypothetical protein
MINSIDSSIKFPDRAKETLFSLSESCRKKDIKEFFRMIVVIYVSLGYMASTTDPIYSAFNKIDGWLNISEEASIPISYTASALGSIGTLPLIVYWSLRGLRQLTFGGQLNDFGQQLDPTDKYTYIGLLLVLPITLGNLGAATSPTGDVFGQLGTFAKIIQVSTSVLYSMFARTPGMALLLRNLFSLPCIKKMGASQKPPQLLANTAEDPNFSSEGDYQSLHDPKI